MFDIGWSELLLIGIVALIVIGPKELPGALRTLGIWMGKVRRMASEFQGQFQEAMREAEIDQLKKDMDDMASKAQNYAQFDPMEDVRKDIEKSMGDLPPLDQPAATPEVATAPPAPDTPETSLPAPVDTSAASASPAEPATTHAPAAPAVADANPEPGKAPA
jgi:sec-independent protein translocase protein TatB